MAATTVLRQLVRSKRWVAAPLAIFVPRNTQKQSCGPECNHRDLCGDAKASYCECWGSRSDQASSNAKSKAKVPKLAHPAKTTSHHKPPQTNLQPQPSTLVPAANHCGVCNLDVASAFSLNRHLLSTAHKAAAAAALATARTAAKNAAATYCGACSLNFATTFSLNRHNLSAAHKTAAAAVPAKDAKKNARANTAAKATTAAALVAAAHAKMYLSGSASTANTDRGARGSMNISKLVRGTLQAAQCSSALSAVCATSALSAVCAKGCGKGCAITQTVRVRVRTHRDLIDARAKI